MSTNSDASAVEYEHARNFPEVKSLSVMASSDEYTSFVDDKPQTLVRDVIFPLKEAPGEQASIAIDMRGVENNAEAIK
jgi:hypothetical protein